MALIYIAGPTGAGKTTVRDELLNRGYEAYDTDEGINAHYNISTGVATPYPAPEAVTPEWLSQHRFSMPEDKIATLSSAAKDKLIFLCGGADNDLELANHFAKIICLYADLGTTKDRVETRKTNNYGKVPAEMDSILQSHDAIVKKYRNFGAVMIDTTEITPEETVAKVLEITDHTV